MKPRFPAIAINCRTVMLALTLLFALGTLWDFGLPGLYMDEVNHYAFIPGILHEEATRLHHYRLPDNWLDYQDKVNRYPIVGGSIYNSTIRPYISIPFFWFAGYSLETLRIFAALTALAATLAATGLLGRMFSWRAALLAGALIVTDPTNAFLMRAQGGLFWFVVLFVSLAGHALLSASRKESPSPWLAIGAGVAISLATSSYYVGFFFALPLLAIAFCIYRRKPSHIAILLIAGLVAYSPIIYSVVSVYLKQPKLLENFGVPAFALENKTPTFSWDNIRRLLEMVYKAFGTFGFAKNVVGNFETNWAAVRLVAIAASLTAALFLAVKKVASATEARFLYLFSCVLMAIYLVAAFFLKSLTYHHLVPVSILIAVLMASLTTRPDRIRMLGWVACGLLLVTNVAGLVSAHSELRRTGGLALHNEMVSEPAAMFRTTLRDYHPVFASWGFHLQYLFQTEGKSPYTFMTKPDRAKIQRAMDRNGAVAVVVWKDLRTDVLKDFQPSREYFFTQRDGFSLYSIMLFEADPTKRAPPKLDKPQPREFLGAASSSSFLVWVDSRYLCADSGAIAKVTWDRTGQRPSQLQIFVQGPSDKERKLWAASSATKGTEATGMWVRPGMVFFFVDGKDGTLIDTVTVDTERCP